MIAGCPPIGEGAHNFSSLSAIDRIGDAFCQSAQNLQRIADVQGYRSFRMRCLGTTLAIIDACNVPSRATVSVRLKRLGSIRRKLGRANTNFTLGRLDDVVGVRVICQSLSTVREFSDRIKTSPSFLRLKDYVTSPAATGYRGIHHIVRFQQPITGQTGISMRFEVQARTYLQHRWAVWSESHGEAVKLGVGVGEEQERLRSLSEDLAQWESENSDAPQNPLYRYSGGRYIVVCWRTRYGPMIPYYFPDQVEDAVDWLSHLETTYPAERDNALLLVGITRTTDAQSLLRLTHPLFTGARVLNPRYWMPTSSS